MVPWLHHPQNVGDRTVILQSAPPPTPETEKPATFSHKTLQITSTPSHERVYGFKTVRKAVTWPEKLDEERRRRRASSTPARRSWAPPFVLKPLNDSPQPSEHVSNFDLLPDSTKLKFPNFNYKHSYQFRP